MSPPTASQLSAPRLLVLHSVTTNCPRSQHTSSTKHDSGRRGLQQQHSRRPTPKYTPGTGVTRAGVYRHICSCALGMATPPTLRLQPQPPQLTPRGVHCSALQQRGVTRRASPCVRHCPSTANVYRLINIPSAFQVEQSTASRPRLDNRQESSLV